MTDRELLEKILNKLEVLELKVDTNKEKLDDLQLDTKIMERNIRRDVRTLRDEMDTVIQVLKMNELIPN